MGAQNSAPAALRPSATGSARPSLVTNGIARSAKNRFHSGNASDRESAAGMPITGAPPGSRRGLFTVPNALRRSACRSKPDRFVLTKRSVS